jgi:pSer/pThr/pTyr-binding forkhead associated (FHA) protein
MAKLVVLSEGLTGRSYELKVDKTTVGRVDDNAFSIPEPSVSSHHCEILLKGNDVVVRDLDSTNGTYVNDERVTEAVLRSGQILRLGQVEMRLETGNAAPPGKKSLDQTLVIPQGVKFGESGTGGTHLPDTATAVFKKKDSKSNKVFWWIIGAVLVVLVGIIGYALSKI